MLNFEKSENLSTNIFQLNRNLNPLVNFEFSKHPRSQEVTQQTLKKTKDRSFKAMTGKIRGGPVNDQQFQNRLRTSLLDQ